MTPYQIICGPPFKRIVDLDFWHLWRLFIATKVSGSLLTDEISVPKSLNGSQKVSRMAKS